jgi:hypothetical protein
MLWVRADRGIYKDASNGVCAWADRSGHQNVFVPPASGGRPTWEDASLGGRPAVHAAPPQQGLFTAGVLGLAPDSPRTFIAVQQLASTAGRFAAIIQGKSGTAGTYVGFDTNTFQTAGSREGVYFTNNAYDSNVTTSTAPRLHVMIIRSMTPTQPVLSNIEYRIDAQTTTLTRTPGGLGNGNIEDFSAADYSGVVSRPAGNASVAEALVYDHALSPTELTAVEGVLEARYGI